MFYSIILSYYHAIIPKKAQPISPLQRSDGLGLLSVKKGRLQKMRGRWKKCR